MISWIPTATLFAMMLALGMTLRPADFLRIAAAPLPALVGLLGQFVVVPAIAFALAWGLPLSETQKVGLVIISACPGGVVSNALTQFARGDLALSITMSAIGNVLAFASVPLVVGLAFDAFGGTATPVSLSFGEMSTTLFATTATPVLLGMALLHFRPALAARIERPLLNVATAALCMLIVGLGVGVSQQSSDELSLTALFARMTGPVVLLVASGMGLGVLAARALRLGGAAARTIALEIGIQNVNLALVVAMTLLNEQRYSGPALVYLPVMFVFAGAVVAAGRRVEPSRVAAVHR